MFRIIIDDGVNDKNGGKMKKEKYEFNEELKKYRNFYIPIYNFLMPFFHFCLGIIYFFQRNTKYFSIEKKKIKSFDNKNIRFFIGTPKVDNLSSDCIYFIHGGGFVFNGAPHHYKLAKKLSYKLKCKFIFIDYRLGPKYKFPYAPNDCYSVYRWIIENKELLNISKLYLVGDSAGGNLAVVTTFMAHDNNIITPDKLILLYPVLTKDLVTDSMLKYTDTPMCNSKDGIKYNRMYYTNDVNNIRKYMAPYEGEIFLNFPPTYIEVAEYDCLHDDGVLFYNKLKDNNVETEFIEVSRAMHGYDIAIESNLVNDLIEKRIKFLKNN